MRTLGAYAIVYIFDGFGHYQDEAGINQHVAAGDLLILFPDLPHRYGPESGQTWSEFYLVFDGPVFRLWEQTGLISKDQPIHHIEPTDHWLNRFESVLGGRRKVGFAPALAEVCRLQQVLGEALMGGPAGPSAASDDADLRWAQRACALLESNLSRQTDLETLASEMSSTYASFRKRFAKIVGLPPARYRATRLIDRACQLMQRSWMTDKQIADELGFCDEFHFSKRFKQIVGCSPRQYRKRLPSTS